MSCGRLEGGGDRRVIHGHWESVGKGDTVNLGPCLSKCMDTAWAPDTRTPTPVPAASVAPFPPNLGIWAGCAVLWPDRS